MTPEEFRCQALGYSIECRHGTDTADAIVRRAVEFENYLRGTGAAQSERETLTLKGPAKPNGNKPPQKG